jgi:hypothetical protein
MTIQDDINTRTLTAVKQAQDFTLTAINRAAERVQPLLAKIELPFGENLPKASEVVEKAFDLSADLLASAKKVAVEYTKAFSVRENKAAPAVKPVAKKTTQAAA